MEELLNNEWYCGLIVLISQIISIYLKTINVIYTSEKKLIPTMVTGCGMGLTWLVSTSVGMNSILSGQLIPILAYLVGGAIGNYLGIKKELNKNKKL